jgi:hypothetical protein
VLCESAPGATGAVKASGGVSERPMTKGCNDVAVDRFHQACRFLASLGFPFPLRGCYSVGRGMSYEAPRPVSAEVQMAQVWDPRLIRERWDFLFKL